MDEKARVRDWMNESETEEAKEKEREEIEGGSRTSFLSYYKSLYKSPGHFFSPLGQQHSWFTFWSLSFSPSLSFTLSPSLSHHRRLDRRLFLQPSPLSPSLFPTTFSFLSFSLCLKCFKVWLHPVPKQLHNFCCNSLLFSTSLIFYVSEDDARMHWDV